MGPDSPYSGFDVEDVREMGGCIVHGIGGFDQFADVSSLIQKGRL